MKSEHCVHSLLLPNTNYAIPYCERGYVWDVGCESKNLCPEYEQGEVPTIEELIEKFGKAK